MLAYIAGIFTGIVLSFYLISSTIDQDKPFNSSGITNRLDLTSFVCTTVPKSTNKPDNTFNENSFISGE